MYFSIVVPTFGRPDEVTELLNSLEKQNNPEFEVILADGSYDDSVKNIADKFKNKLNLKHLHKHGLGISESRNLGVENATGDYIVFFDSDCVIPPDYFVIIEKALSECPYDLYGGPDRADDSFNNSQKAISYAMTSFFTTGGIRGNKSHIGKFQPRSFNMGIRRAVFNELGGFSGLKVSEDIDLSLRIRKHGFSTGLIEEAYVYHKRRSTLYKFFRQVLSFGSGRVDLQVIHGNALKIVHLMPSAFVLFFLSGIVSLFISKTIFLGWAAVLLLYFTAVFIDSLLKNNSFIVAILSVYASFIMLAGYGTGMLKAIIMRLMLRSKRESVKPEITKEA